MSSRVRAVLIYHITKYNIYGYNQGRSQRGGSGGVRQNKLSDSSKTDHEEKRGGWECKENVVY